MNQEEILQLASECGFSIRDATKNKDIGTYLLGGDIGHIKKFCRAVCKYQIEQDAKICDDMEARCKECDYNEIYSACDCADFIRNQEGLL